MYYYSVADIGDQFGSKPEYYPNICGKEFS